MSESRPDLVFDEVKRRIVRQEASLDHLRLRAGGMLTVAALVAGLFGGRVLSGHHGSWRSVLEICALVLFGLTVAVVIYIEWPRAFDFGHDPTTWLDTLASGGVVDVVDFAANVGRQLNEQHGKNKGKIEDLWAAYTVVCVLIGLQVLAWGAAAV